VSRPRGDHDERREVISRAAAAVIAERGLERLTLRDLAAELGVTTGALTHYFPSQDALVAHTKELVFDARYARARLAAEQAEGRERLHAVVEELLPLDDERRTSWRVLVAFRGSAVGSAELRRAHAVRMRRWFALFESLVTPLAPADRGGARTDVAELGMAVALLVEGMAIHFAMLEPPLPSSRQVAFARTQIARLLSAADAGGGRTTRATGRRRVSAP